MGVDAAVGLAAERGIPAVAKGIETADQLAELYRRGCPAGQGFLFARPMDPADAEAYLRRVTRPGVSASPTPGVSAPLRSPPAATGAAASAAPAGDAGRGRR